MHTYAHSYYISCSQVGLSSDLKKPKVVDESLSVFKPMCCYENTINYSIYMMLIGYDNYVMLDVIVHVSSILVYS